MHFRLVGGASDAFPAGRRQEFMGRMNAFLKPQRTC